jgi:hypothetical protein
MIPFSLSWDTEKRSVSFKWNGLFSLGWEEGKVLTKILGFPIPIRLRKKRIGLSIRWIYVKEALSFLRKWRLRRAEVIFSFPDPMVNGLLYGLISGLETGKRDRRIHIHIDFLGKNRFTGEAIISPGRLFSHLKRWTLLFLGEKRKRIVRRR